MAVLAVLEVAVLALIVTRVLPEVGSYSAAADALPFVAAAPGLGYPRAQQLNQAAFAIGNGVPGGGAFGLGVQYAMSASWSYPAVAAPVALLVGLGTLSGSQRRPPSSGGPRRSSRRSSSASCPLCSPGRPTGWPPAGRRRTELGMDSPTGVGGSSWPEKAAVDD